MITDKRRSVSCAAFVCHSGIRFPTDTAVLNRYSPLALPLGELSPKVTERVLHPGFPSPSSLCSATSPKGRGKGAVHYSTVPVNRLMRPAHLLRVTGLVGK